MGRAWTPEGKRVPIGLKVSEAKAKAVDAARGATPRAQWLAAAVDAALAAGTVSEAAKERPEPPRVRAKVPAPDPVEAVRALAEASGAPLVTASELPDRSSRRGRPGRGCDHYVPAGTKCKLCGPKS
jgi:nucleotide-binding universal stress UspA family protein